MVVRTAFCINKMLRSMHRCISMQVFSLLAIATSYIGFTLGLSDFLSDLLKVGSRVRSHEYCCYGNGGF